MDIRLVKDKLSRVAGGEGDKVTVNKDYTTGFVEGASARIFIHCLSTTYVIPFPSSVPPHSDLDLDCPDLL